MAVTLYTRSANSESWVERDLMLDQWRVTDALNERSTASFTVRDATGTLIFEPGHGVRLLNGSEVLFQGHVTEASEARLGVGGVRLSTLEAVDHHYLLDKRVVVDAWTDTLAGDIVRDLITSTLADEGITAGDIRDGEELRAFTINYRSVADAISDLATRCGYWWRVDSDRRLHFAPPSAFIALYAGDDTILAGDDTPLAGAAASEGSVTTVTRSVMLADTLQVSRRSGGYRNQQWVRGGYDQTDPQVEVFKGDDVQRTFTVAFPVSEQPTIEVDRGGGYEAETVGVAGFDSGTRQWYFSHRSHAITQDEAQAVLGVDDRLRVTYVGEFSVVTRVSDPAEVERVALLDGGTGIVDSVLDDKAVRTREAALQRSAQLLSYYARPAATVRFATRSTTFAPGQLVSLDVPEANLDGEEALITSVEWFATGGEVRAVVTLSIGPSEGSWAVFFLNLLARVDAATAPEGSTVDVVTSTASFERDWEEADRPNIFTRFTPQAGLYPSSDVIPAFDFDDRVKYLAWYQDGEEAGRRAITQQTGAETDEIESVTVLGVNDAVGDNTHLAWVGGAEATAEVGTGVTVTTIAYPFSKTNVEALQVVMTDTKDF